jgi:hypothetical protein
MRKLLTKYETFSQTSSLSDSESFERAIQVDQDHPSSFQINKAFLIVEF